MTTKSRRPSRREPVTLTLPTASARETFSRPQTPVSEQRDVAEIYEALTDPDAPPDTAFRLAHRFALYIREEGRLWVGVFPGSITTWAELAPLEFRGTLRPPNSLIGPGIPRDDTDVEGVLDDASVPVDRLLDVFLGTDFLLRIRISDALADALYPPAAPS